MKTFVSLATGVCLLMALAVSQLVERRVETYRDANVRAGQLVSPITSVFVHLFTQNYITVNDKTYRGVRGLKPYYLNIPELNSILFVTEEHGRAILHVVNLGSWSEVQFDARTSGFGGHIGSGRRKGEPGSDYIARVQSNRITVVKNSVRWKDQITLNLDTKRIESEECFYFDPAGLVTNRSITSGQ